MGALVAAWTNRLPDQRLPDQLLVSLNNHQRLETTA